MNREERDVPEVPVMRVQTWREMSPAARAQLMDRGTSAIFDPALRASIERILLDVRDNGDEAVSRALRDFDGVDVEPDRLRVSEAEFDTARQAVGSDLLGAIRAMIAGIRRFNDLVMTRKAKNWWQESSPGLFVGEKITPIASAGLFCPSGKASYPSVLAQIGTPCVVAGVTTRVVITPPVPGSRSGQVDAATLVVADELGLRDVFRVNGPAGIAAAAFGTESVPRCGKVVGPGSPAVAAAQIAVQGFGCSTMMLLGPSESMILADGSADPVLLAADLLNEAEHGTDSSSVLVTPDADLVAATQRELTRQISVLPPKRREAAEASLGTNGGCIIVHDLAEAAEVANAYGPEHMQLVCADHRPVLDRLVSAGEILIGQNTAISAANFVIGCPASLPTSGFSSVSSGITVEAFLKRTALASASAAAMREMAPAVTALADHEGFPAHANAMRIRTTGWPTTGVGQ